MPRASARGLTPIKKGRRGEADHRSDLAGETPCVFAGLDDDLRSVAASALASAGAESHDYARWWSGYWQVLVDTRSRRGGDRRGAAHSPRDARRACPRAFAALSRRLSRALPASAPIDALPVMTKHALMADFDRWVTDPAIRYDKLTAFLADRSHIGEALPGPLPRLEETPGRRASPASSSRMIARCRLTTRWSRCSCLRWRGPATASPGCSAAAARRWSRQQAITSRASPRGSGAAARHPASPHADSTDHGSIAGAGRGAQRLRAGLPRELSDDAGAARRGAEGGTAAHRAGDRLVRR